MEIGRIGAMIGAVLVVVVVTRAKSHLLLLNLPQRMEDLLARLLRESLTTGHGMIDDGQVN
jgi:hypothetical protein